ncbi:hypothetical protein CKO25_11610 [Thiocapsa imhoffii]|uniref:Glycosyltransferase 2-like domain-containing protein n=1 Tax=Thiocapsa imhoffii TaxID=382777 RepID=A0A9X1B8U9_9GAMM|nr:glycosyltransferase family 2 protein [Thiocapsa imhoffii]MBK1645274.1 hypothetical protein [Thiocapsa imhoffii]
MMPIPKLSVIMPSYNSEATIELAIESVINQSFKDWELIVVDDGSTDMTRDKLHHHASLDKRIKVHHHKHQGRGYARNKCLAHVRGELVGICDSDDLSCPSRFQKQIEYLERHPYVGVLGGQACGFTGNSVPDQGRLISWPPNSNDIHKAFNRRRMGIANCTAVIRTKLFKEHGGYCEELHRAQDYEFFARLNSKGVEMSSLTEVLVFYKSNHPIPAYNYFRENYLYTEYANYVLSGGTLSFKRFSQTARARWGRSFLLVSYVKFFLLMTKRQFSTGLCQC